MITFLEYVCERLMGPPRYGSMWNCPFHDDNNPSFSVRPPKKRPNGSYYKIKYKCFGCQAWGDEWDLLKHFYPKETQPQLKARLNKYRQGYENLTGIKLPSPGIRGQESEDAQDRARFALSEYRYVLRERGLKWKGDHAGLRCLVWAEYIANENGVELRDLIRCAASELIDRPLR